MERAFADTLERHETVTLIEGDCVGFRIGHDSNATEPVTLIKGQPKDVPEQRTSQSAALCSNMDTKSGKPEHRQRIAGKSTSQPGRRDTPTFQARRRHGCEAKNSAVCCRNMRDRQVQLELVLSSVMLEESIVIGLSAGEGASVVVRA